MSDDKTPRDLLDWLGITDAPRWWVARPLGPLVSVLLAILLVLAVVAAFAVLLHTVAMARSGASEGINLGAGALIVALLGAPFLIWSTVLKHQTLRYQKEGHITDRINKAVEQLGAEKTVKVRGKDAEGKDITIEETRPNLEVRIGAILSLERIAQDSTRYDRGRDHVRVMEILCAYVRENAPASSAQDHPFGEWEPLKDDPTEEEHAAHLKKREERFGSSFMTAQVRQWAQSLPGPRTDIEITLKVIGRRSIEQRRVEAAWPNPPDKATEWPFDNKCPELIDRPYGSPASENDLKAFTSALSNWKKQIKNYKGYRLNLSGINCQGINLQSDRQDSSDLVFCGAILKGARFEGANLSRVRLKGANLLGARLQGARLWQTFLQGASISDARLEGADLNGARMEASNLTYSRMEAVGMTGTWLSAATFYGTRLEAASLLETHLEAAQLSSTTLCGAKLYAARLDGADLYRVKFDRTIEIIGTELTGISLREVSIREIELAQESIEGAFGDASVEIPQSLRRPLFWPRTRLAHFGEHSFESQLRKWRSDPAAYTPPS